MSRVPGWPRGGGGVRGGAGGPGGGGRVWPVPGPVLRRGRGMPWGEHSLTIGQILEYRLLIGHWLQLMFVINPILTCQHYRYYQNMTFLGITKNAKPNSVLTRSFNFRTCAVVPRPVVRTASTADTDTTATSWISTTLRSRWLWPEYSEADFLHWKLYRFLFGVKTTLYHSSHTCLKNVSTSHTENVWNITSSMYYTSIKYNETHLDYLERRPTENLIREPKVT